MPTDIHDVIARFEDSGTAVITIASTDYNIVNSEPGSLAIDPAMRTPMPFTTKGVQQAPIQGEDMLGKIRMRVKVAGFAATSLMKLLTDANSSSNAVPEYSFVIKVPTKRGGTTGTSFTTTNASTASPPKWQSGAQFDTVEFELNYRTHTVATY